MVGYASGFGPPEKLVALQMLPGSGRKAGQACQQGRKRSFRPAARTWLQHFVGPRAATTHPAGDAGEDGQGVAARAGG